MPRELWQEAVHSEEHVARYYYIPPHVNGGVELLRWRDLLPLLLQANEVHVGTDAVCAEAKSVYLSPQAIDASTGQAASLLFSRDAEQLSRSLLLNERVSKNKNYAIVEASMGRQEHLADSIKLSECQIPTVQ
ncbi:unnamed protein product [Protopolystoma xenopodis]|uniref:Uncharacterized protein n=1 Tax=Protopolystoma xenopodis TaxID=117903 RepID=A0A3S5A9T4_9PLAT|nr:unnamed protein product [Protopolystoma xenopodis]